MRLVADGIDHHTGGDVIARREVGQQPLRAARVRAARARAADAGEQRGEDGVHGDDEAGYSRLITCLHTCVSAGCKLLVGGTPTLLLKHEM